MVHAPSLWSFTPIPRGEPYLTQESRMIRGRSFIESRTYELLWPDIAIGTALILATASFSIMALPASTALFLSMLGALMVVGALVDTRTYCIPNVITYGAIVIGMVAVGLQDSNSALL